MDSPYRDITGSVLNYIAEIHREDPRGLIVVYIPEYVVGRWWEHLLHNQSALRLKARLLFQRHLMVTSVPWQLDSSRRTSRTRSTTATQSRVVPASRVMVMGSAPATTSPRRGSGDTVCLPGSP